MPRPDGSPLVETPLDALTAPDRRDPVLVAGCAQGGDPAAWRGHLTPVDVRAVDAAVRPA